MARRSFAVPGLAHGTNPTPTVTRVGPLVATSAIPGWDRSTQQLPPDLGTEVAYAFDNLAVSLTAAGASLEDVAHVDVFAASSDVRAHLNEVWVEHFPDAGSRPTRHLIVMDLPAGLRLQVEATAWSEAWSGEESHG